MQQSQTQEAIDEHAPSGSPQSIPPAMTECDINIIVRRQRCGHMKGVGHLLTRLGSQADASSSATPNSTSFVLGSSSTLA